MSSDVQMWYRTERGEFKFVATFPLTTTDTGENIFVLDEASMEILKERIADVQDIEDDDNESD